MIHITLPKLERKLGIPIQKNAFCVGIDTASTSGVAIITTTNNKVIIETEIIKIPKIPRDTEDKSAKYEESLNALLIMIRDFKKRMCENKKANSKTILVLENSFLSFDPWTFGFLKGFMGLLYAELFDYFENIRIVFPTSARKQVGFKSQLPKKSKRDQKKAEIIQWVSNLLEVDLEDDNICDAIILALTGLVR
jgi:hypothetical protein